MDAVAARVRGIDRGFADLEVADRRFEQAWFPADPKDEAEGRRHERAGEPEKVSADHVRRAPDDLGGVRSGDGFLALVAALLKGSAAGAQLQRPGARDEDESKPDGR